MAANITNTMSGITYDQEKFLVNKLLDRSSLRLVMGGLCDNINMREGAGLTAYMVRYKRMFVPLTALSEGTTPTQAAAFTLEEVTVTLDQWGDYLELTDVVQLTVKHPIMTQVTELLADNAARVMDREIMIVMLAGTNVQYGDASVTTRATITSAMTLNESIIQKVRVTMVNAGAPPRGGPSSDAKQVATTGNFLGTQNYVAVCGPEVIGDITRPSTSFGSWASAATYANAKALYATEVGTWANVRFVETNFIPKFVLLGNTTTAVASGAAFGTDTPVVTGVASGGTFDTGTIYFKVTRKDKLRGFEEAISIPHSQASAHATDGSFTFNFSSLTAGYVYNLYIDTEVAGGDGTDSQLALHTANIEVGTTTTVLGIGTGAAPPSGLRNSGDGLDPAAVHPVFVVGEAALAWAGFYKSRVLMSPTGATKDDPLAQRRTIGYKFFGKAVIKDQTRMLRLEVASTY
ncbi:MAG: N4-gp56 family major capsid protein [Burkholderiales bacterium]